MSAIRRNNCRPLRLSFLYLARSPPSIFFDEFVWIIWSFFRRVFPVSQSVSVLWQKKDQSFWARASQRKLSVCLSVCPSWLCVACFLFTCCQNVSVDLLSFFFLSFLPVCLLACAVRARAGSLRIYINQGEKESRQVTKSKKENWLTGWLTGWLDTPQTY